jgi:hypothetical protein
MSNADIALPAPAVGPDRIGQGTAIEQSRAVAQVQAAVVVAHQFPRDEQRAIRAMHEACARPSLANMAFYAYSRGGTNVTGSTIKLAQELARIWGNIDFGLAELRLDTVAGESEMLAFAWDMETNARFSQIVIVKHVRDRTVDGVKVAERLTDQRDVYELNTSNAARRLRECVRRVVPDWFFDEAETRCHATLENPSDGFTLAQRIAQVTRGFENGFGVDLQQLELHVGKPRAAWTGWDVAQLNIVGESIKRGDLPLHEAFPVDVVTPAEIRRRSQQPATPAAASSPAVDADPAPAPASTASTPAPEPVQQDQLIRINGHLTTCAVTGLAAKLVTIGRLIGRELSASSDLTAHEGSQVIATLERVTKLDDPGRALDHYLANLDQADTESETS